MDLLLSSIIHHLTQWKMADGLEKNNALVLQRAIKQYGVRPTMHSGGPTHYTDAFALPDYYHPTYEVSSMRSRLNPNAHVAGFSLAEMTSVEDLYNLMLPVDYERNVLLAYNSLKFRNKPENTPGRVLQYQLEVCFKLKGKGGKLYYYKRTSNENGMVNGKITHALSYWEDITFMTKSQLSYWKLSAKNAEFFDIDLPELGLYQGLLSNREADLLRLLARGFSSYDIGRMMHITKNTVDTHRRNMLRKMEVSNTPELIDIARDMNIV